MDSAFASASATSAAACCSAAATRWRAAWVETRSRSSSTRAASARRARWAMSKSSSTFARRAWDSASRRATRSWDLGDQLVGAQLGLLHDLLGALAGLGDHPLDLGLTGGVPLEQRALLGVGLLADGLRVELGGPADLPGLLLGELQHVLDALADVLEGRRRGGGGLAAQRLDLVVHRRELAGHVRGAGDGGVAVGEGDPEVRLEALDGVGDLAAVVPPHDQVERVLHLVHGQIVAGVAHVVILADGGTSGHRVGRTGRNRPGRTCRHRRPGGRAEGPAPWWGSRALGLRAGIRRRGSG
ncbi:hypothetical protein JKP75_14470 [Blastococcus sp. TML/M2B]|uniref:hypothetical protein n=1 Tax=Blastococcus sp. TML/M2B TaxID=2798727 RepID=UPI00190AE4B5|nr:hypothetical protein [Blastococcus sp. TML/M2B]MBN1093654.1 hypothetical protein [Blastococcus sp. TML/M2B]